MMGHVKSPDSGDDGLTPRQRAIVRVIDESVRRNGYWPSLREIGEATGLASTSSVSHQIKRLVQKGVVVREPGRPRTIMLRRQPGPVPPTPETGARGAAWDEPALVQMEGRIAAGGPITAERLPGDAMALPRLLVGYGDLFMLTVSGDSMTGAAIADGDWVVIRRQDSAESGEIVAAMIEGDAGWEATVKTYRKRDGHAWLIPHNPAYAPIPGDSAKILGKLTAVLRRV
jgi:repressor LexA